MKKFNFIKRLAVVFAIFTIAIFTTSCTKDQPANPSDGTYDVNFNINSVLQNGGLKLSTDILCSTLKGDYVVYKIDGGEFKTIPIFYVGDIPWTNSIKLPTGNHTLNEFIVYSDNNTPNDLSDDIPLMATPHVGSAYAGYVTTPLDKSFTITTDKKNEIKLDVVCFEAQYYNNFGFVYFKLNQLIIREQWFFGDFCIKEKSDYNGSQYSQQSGWGTGTGFIDAPAIIKIEVWRGGVLQNTFTNTFEGEKLSVKYGDYMNQTDQFEFKLFIFVKEGNQFNYVFFKNWYFNDISNISQTDGVVGFVLGNCYDPNNPPNYIFPPWMNLPLTANYTITGFPSNLGGYVDATLSGIPTGYDIYNGTYASNCADHTVTINVGQTYTMNVYSSLYPDKLPTWAQSPKWAKINWLYNHLDYFPNHLWSDIQGAIWLYDIPIWNGSPESGMPGLSPMMTTMKNNMELYGSDYKVPPGGWAAIIFIANNQAPTVQTMFVHIDP